MRTRFRLTPILTGLKSTIIILINKNGINQGENQNEKL